MLTLTRNRSRAATIALAFIVALLVCVVLPLLLAPPALAAEPDLTVALNLDPTVLWAFAVIAGLLALKLILGVAGAIRDGTFDVRELPAILRTNVLPYMIPLAAMAALSVVMPAVKAIYLGSAALYVAKLIADIKDGISRFYGLTSPPDVPTSPDPAQPPAN